MLVLPLPMYLTVRAPGRAAEAGPRTQTPANHVECLNGVPVSWFQPDPASARSSCSHYNHLGNFRCFVSKGLFSFFNSFNLHKTAMCSTLQIRRMMKQNCFISGQERENIHRSDKFKFQAPACFLSLHSPTIPTAASCTHINLVHEQNCLLNSSLS